MKNYFRLAWRNIWRNKRRTLLTAASVSLAIFLALIMRSMQTGVFSHIVNNIVESYTGYIQIHKKGYWNEKEDINNSFQLNDSLKNNLNKISNVSIYVPRLESFALASKDEQSKGVALIGIDPDKENRFTNISKKIIRGKYLTSDDKGIIVSQGLAKYLKLKESDTLVLIGQGFEGTSAAGKYPVRGIIHFPSPDLNNRIVYMNLPVCQEFFGSENRITSISFNLIAPEKIDKTFKEIKSAVNANKYEVMKWDEMLVEIVQFIKSKNIGSYFLIGILYMIVAFGIFGTVLMMTTERIKEFGVVVSIGMQKTKLALIVAIEMVYIGITGILFGMIAATPIIYYFYTNPLRLSGDMAKTMEDFGMEPILSVAFQPDIYFTHSLLILLIVLFAIIYPIRKIMKLNVVSALRSK
ncbi:MAG: ABC transporter permease [Bacteroidetes bacterium]|nr:ABC transporter permease [Bacteroidota bacterium]